MLSVPELQEKLAEAYEHATHDRVDSFQKADDEITALIANYVQQITYASDAVIKLNKLQVSNIITQSVKILAVACSLVLVVVGLGYVPYDPLGELLAGVTIGVGLVYAWRKIPHIRQLWADTTNIGIHGINLNTSLSQSILALEQIKVYHQDTRFKIQEWERKGLLNKPEKSEDKDPYSLEEFLDSVRNRSRYEDDPENKE